MSYKLLSEPIRKYIRDKRWESLRPIQAAAISKIITTDNNLPWFIITHKPMKKFINIFDFKNFVFCLAATLFHTQLR